MWRLKPCPVTSNGQESLVGGVCRLLDFSADTSVVKNLFEAISKKAGCTLLDQCRKHRVQLFHRQESGYRQLGDMSLVTSSYHNGELAGVLGVIGPTRMDYKDVIPVVDVTAKVLSAAMRNGS